MPTEEITINGFRFLVPCPYVEGHVCTEAEATILNKRLHAALRANFAKLMDKMTVEGKAEDFTRNLAKQFSDYCDSYNLNGGDQIEAEARAIALAMLKAQFKKAKRPLNEVGKDEINRQIEAILNLQRQAIYAQARVRIKSLREAAQKELARLAS